MQALNCLIVEDEPLAADIICDYIAQVPLLELKGVCENVFEAMEKLRDEKIDLIFLDINLPKLSGIDFLKTIRHNCQVILTTAYHQYALESYDLDVTDYLLKPIEFPRFLQAVNKVLERKGQAGISEVVEKKYFFFNVDKKKIKVFAEDIFYIEAMKDYVRIHTSGKKLVTKFAISEMEELLKGGFFLRIHKSFIVNTSKINVFSASEVELEGVSLKIGRTFRKEVEEVFKRLKSS